MLVRNTSNSRSATVSTAQSSFAPSLPTIDGTPEPQDTLAPTTTIFSDRPESLYRWNANEIVDGLIIGSAEAGLNNTAHSYFNINAVLSVLTPQQLRGLKNPNSTEQSSDFNYTRFLKDKSDGISKINGNWLRFDFADTYLKKDIQKELHTAADFIHRHITANQRQPTRMPMPTRLNNDNSESRSGGQRPSAKSAPVVAPVTYKASHLGVNAITPRHHSSTSELQCPTPDITPHSSCSKLQAEQNYIYVHCQAGLSRAPTMVAAYLVKYREMNFEAAMEYIESRRYGARPNAYFKQQLEAFEIELFYTGGKCCTIL